MHYFQQVAEMGEGERVELTRPVAYADFCKGFQNCDIERAIVGSYHNLHNQPQ